MGGCVAYGLLAASVLRVERKEEGKGKKSGLAMKMAGLGLAWLRAQGFGREGIGIDLG